MGSIHTISPTEDRDSLPLAGDSPKLHRAEPEVSGQRNRVPPEPHSSFDKRQATHYNRTLRIRNFSHKPLKRFYEEGITKSLPADSIPKLRAMFAVLDQMKDAGELTAWPLWKAHTLTGDRKGTWSLHVTRNWRLTFRVEADELLDVNLEDYH